MSVTATRVRVLIVDDRPLVSAGIQEVLGEDGSIDVIGVAATASEAMRIACAECPGVIFVDARLPEHSGFDLITQMRRTCPLTECLVLAVSDDVDNFRDALNRGAHGYLLEDASAVEICSAVQRVAAGKSHIDPAVSGYLVHIPHGNSLSGEHKLTDREIDVLRLAAQGLTNSAIARRLNLKTETIKTHLSRAFARLGARDRANAVAIGMRRGLI